MITAFCGYNFVISVRTLMFRSTCKSHCSLLDPAYNCTATHKVRGSSGIYLAIENGSHQAVQSRSYAIFVHFCRSDAIAMADLHPGHGQGVNDRTVDIP